jgi:hypothetical protein
LSGRNSSGSNSSSSYELDTTMRALSIRDAQTTPARQHAAAAAAAFVAAAAAAAAGQHQQPMGLDPNLSSNSDPKAGVNLKSLCQLQQEGDVQQLQQTGSSKSPPALIAAVAAAAAAGGVDLRAVKQLTDSAAFSVREGTMFCLALRLKMRMRGGFALSSVLRLGTRATEGTCGILSG